MVSEHTYTFQLVKTAPRLANSEYNQNYYNCTTPTSIPERFSAIFSQNLGRKLGGEVWGCVLHSLRLSTVQIYCLFGWFIAKDWNSWVFVPLENLWCKFAITVHRNMPLPSIKMRYYRPSTVHLPSIDMLPSIDYRPLSSAQFAYLEGIFD